MDKVAIAEALAHIQPFAALPDGERVELAGRMRARRYPRDGVVFHRGDHAADVFVILAGTVKVVLLDETGRETVVALLRGGDIFGELALFGEAQRSATVATVAETLTLVLSREDFLPILEHSPRAMRQMLGLMATTIRRLSDRVEDLVFLDVPSRVAKGLLDLGDLNADGGGVIALTQDDLAALVGATRVSVNRTLADLETRGIVELARRHIRIVDPAALRREIRH